MPNKKIAILTIHGQGRTETNYAEGLRSKLRHHIGAEAWDNQVHFESIYYQDLIEPFQKKVWDNMNEKLSLLQRTALRWRWFRELMFFNFGDTAALGFMAHVHMSLYEKTQERILEALASSLDHLGCVDAPVIVVAQSLGCHVLSNYIWDAQQEFGQTTIGIWRPAALENKQYTEAEFEFLKMKSLRCLFMTGCNIPLFVSGLDEIEAIRPPNQDFRWYNLFDKDDILGWPLRTLSGSYQSAVTEDVKVNAGNFLVRWTPLSHNYYWETDEVLALIGTNVAELLEG